MLKKLHSITTYLLAFYVLVSIFLPEYEEITAYIIFPFIVVDSIYTIYLYIKNKERNLLNLVFAIMFIFIAMFLILRIVG